MLKIYLFLSKKNKSIKKIKILFYRTKTNIKNKNKKYDSVYDFRRHYIMYKTINAKCLYRMNPYTVISLHMCSLRNFFTISQNDRYDVNILYSGIENNL